MMAIQFQANKDTETRDSRDLNEIRISLLKERERSQLLLHEISKYDQLLYQYETSRNKDDQVSNIMEKELKRIKLLAGFEDIVDKGFIIRIQEMNVEEDYEYIFAPFVYDDDLRMIVNELNAYGAKAISINEQRMIASSAIRNVGDRILVNTIPIIAPYEIKVIGDSSILIPALRLAGLEEYFMIVNHSIQYEAKELIRIPAYNQRLDPYFLKPVKEASG